MIPASLSPLANHVWQSTLFAAVAALLTLALQKNRAQVRYWLWLAASIKFLIPFSLLISAGSQVEWRNAPALAPPLAAVIEPIRQPLATPAFTLAPPAARSALPVLPVLLVAVWFAGCAAFLSRWWARWWRMRAALRAASPLPIQVPLKVMSSSTLLEPGVFGIFRPVLLMPEGIANRLAPTQLRAVLAHEFCHVRRHDNLAAALHMVVETIFWFHPVVWWIGARMIEERERACDEEVLRLGNEPQAYAEGILNVCKFYLESPLACVSGVTGADLKKRIEEIMKNQSSLRLTFGKKLLLAAAGMLVASAPLIVGLARAQIHASPTFEVASLREVPVDGGPAVLSMGPRRTGGRFDWTSPLSLLASYAYHLPRWRISGIEKDRSIYVIAATMDASATEDQVRLMLQALLVERFKIVSHRETKEFQGYALVVAKNGPKLKTANGRGEAPPMPDYWPGMSSAAFEGRIVTSMEGIGTSAITGRGVSTSQLADELSASLGTFVWDRTGLTGKYYFGFKFLSVARPSDDADAASIFSVVQDELGLKLEKQKGPVEVLVVDHIEKPSEN